MDDGWRTKRERRVEGRKGGRERVWEKQGGEKRGRRREGGLSVGEVWKEEGVREKVGRARREWEEADRERGRRDAKRDGWREKRETRPAERGRHEGAGREREGSEKVVCVRARARVYESVCVCVREREREEERE